MADPLMERTRLMNPQEAAILLRVTVGTLSGWRITNKVQIPYIKVGKSVRYRLVDLDRFIAEHTHK